MKRCLAISDTHCGHKFGLTPPSYWKRLGKEATYAQETWRAFIKKLDASGPFHRVFLAGDLIDGTGTKSGGTELVTSDIYEQAEIFEEVFKTICLHCQGKIKTIMVYGTGYHVSPEGQDIERFICDHIEADKIGSHEWPEVEGVVFDIKHHCGRSSVPHGQYTGQAKEALWNELWTIDDGQPLASVYLRGHTHYFRYGGDSRKLFMTLPCLTWGSKFGSRRCAERIDWGITWFDCEKGKLVDWGYNIEMLNCMKGRITKL